MNKKKLTIIGAILILMLTTVSALFFLPETETRIMPPKTYRNIIDTQNCPLCWVSNDSTGIYDNQTHNAYEIKHNPINDIHETNYWASGEYNQDSWIILNWNANHSKYVTKITLPINYNWNWFTDLKLEYSPYCGEWITIWHNTNLQLSDCTQTLIVNGDYYCDIEIPVNQTMYMIKVTGQNNSYIAGAKENRNGALAINDIKIEYIN